DDPAGRESAARDRSGGFADRRAEEVSRRVVESPAVGADRRACPERSSFDRLRTSGRRVGLGGHAGPPLHERHMPVPWLRILDIVIGFTDLARSRKIGQAAQQREQAEAQPQSLEATGRGGVPGGPGGPGGLEARLAGVVVAALKEAFDRDTRRLELERAELEAERERADRALRLELRRQAGDRALWLLVAGLAFGCLAVLVA